MQNRNIEALKEPFKTRFKGFISEWNKWNPTLEIFLVEGLRDLATQKEYVKKGVSKTLQSNHLTGQAGDIAFKDPKNGLYLEKRKDAEFIWGKLMELGHKYHLANGYYTLNRGFDKPHFQNYELQKPIGSKVANYEFAKQGVAKFTS